MSVFHNEICGNLREVARRRGTEMKLFLKLLSIQLIVVSSAWANVSLKNGNFFIGFKDLHFSGGFELQIDRTYNSKSAHNGFFGFGWGSDYEVYITEMPDRSVVVHENGGGANNRFTVEGKSSPEDVKKSVEMIVAAKQKEGANKEQIEKYRADITNDARMRSDEWQRFWEKGLVKTVPLAVGTRLKSNRFSYQLLTKTKDGYVRNFDNGRVETFDARGRLVRIADKNRNFVVITYDKQGRLATIEDNFNRRLNFTFNNMGKVTKITAAGGKQVTYEYDGHMLLKSKDAAGNAYSYKYSNDGRFNLVEIKYTDGSTLQIGYNPPSKGETVAWQKDQDGTRTEYEYGSDGKGSLHYWTAVTVKSSDGKVISKSKYDYTDKVKPDGEHYTYRLYTEIDGERTETIYNECCGLPLKIVKNGNTTTFEYDMKGHVTKKITPTEVTELSYDAKVNKVSKVVKYSKTNSNKSAQQWATYEYDQRGNLVFAKNSQKKGVRIIYDTVGRIKALVDQDQRRLEFVYNEHSKPVQISDPKVGKINVTYSNNGEIMNVTSSGGRKIAMQVTSAFQNLLDIIRPAGVTLSF
jgi:YD repeat-containing protein